MTDGQTDVQIVPWTAAHAISLPGTAEVGDVLVLPSKFSPEGVALYPDDLAGVPKTARNHGYRIDLGHVSDGRAYVSEYSSDAVTEIVVAVVQALTPLGVNGIMWLIKRRLQGLGYSIEGANAPEVTLKIAKLVDNADERLIEGLEITGPADGIQSALDTLANRNFDGGA